ncbi:hypothetical protein TWF506_005309 [Arthrobotrys conoides]|uniref:Uncharacterized protein n=1 Tax=Arthrobotrys conoides TaxID=74498 RepID=A0AAN8NDZ0_9PEZI
MSGTGQVRQMLVNRTTVWKLSESGKIYTKNIRHLLQPDYIGFAETWKKSGEATAKKAIIDMLKKEAQDHIDKANQVNNPWARMEREKFQGILDAYNAIAQGKNPWEVARRSPYGNRYGFHGMDEGARMASNMYDRAHRQVKDIVDDRGEWVLYDGPGVPADRLWRDHWTVFSVRWQSGQTIVKALKLNESDHGYSADLVVSGRCEFSACDATWTRIDLDSGEVKWLNPHCRSKPNSESNWIKYSVGPFSGRASGTYHFLKDKGYDIYHVIEGVGINHIKAEVSSYMVFTPGKGREFCSLTSNETFKSSCYELHDDIIYWINDQDLVCKARGHKGPAVKIYDGRATSFCISYDGILFVYNCDRDLVEHASALSNQPTANTVLNWVPIRWDQGTVKGMMASEDALVVHNGDDIKLYVTKGMERHDNSRY